MSTFFLDKTKVAKEGVNGIMDNYVVVTMNYQKFICFRGFSENYEKIYDLDDDYAGMVVFDEERAVFFAELTNRIFKANHIDNVLICVRVGDLFKYDFSLN